MLINFNHLKTFYNALVHKMKSFRGNWEQNDPTADDYIKNRPFYSETSALEEIVKQTTLDFTNANTVDWNQPKEGYIFEYELDFPIEDGVGYTVTVDGKSYIVTAFYEQTYNNLIVGNGAFVGSNNEDNGLPFAIGKYDAEETKAYVIVPNNKCYVFSINKGSEVVHKIDKKYLPDDIGAGNLAEVAKTGSYYDLIDAPVVFDDVVRYNNQALTVQQQNIARANIDAASNSDVVSLANITAKTSDLEEVKIAAANMAAVVLAEAQADASNKSAVVLAEAQKGISEVDAKLDSKADADHVHDDKYYTRVDIDTKYGNVENKSSATIRGELTKENVVAALGYTPPETDTTYTAITNAEIDEICGAAIYAASEVTL